MNVASVKRVAPADIAVERLIAYATFVFCFTPFFSFYPIPADVQPLFIALILVLLAIAPRMQNFNRYELTFIVLGLWSILYVDPGDPYFSVRKSLGLLIAFLSYHFFRKYGRVLSQPILLLIVSVNFGAVLLHFVAPDLFIETVGRFVRVVKITSMDGPRGAAGFAAEPGFIGALSVFYLAVSLYLREFVGDKRYFIPIALLSISMMAMSKSGTAGVLLILFLALKYFRMNVRSLIIGFLVLVALYHAAAYLNLGRAGYAIRYLFDDPVYLFTVDRSVGQRVINIAVGVLSVYEFPFGAGAGSFDKTAALLIEKYGLSQHIAGLSGNVSAFAKYSVELGAVFWLFLISLVLKALHAGGRASVPYIVVALFFISASFSIVFPPTWFIFASLHRHGRLTRRAGVSMRRRARERVVETAGSPMGGTENCGRTSMIKVANVIEDGRLAGPQIRISEVANSIREHGVLTEVILPAAESDVFRSRLEAQKTPFHAIELHKPGKDKRVLIDYAVTFPREVFHLYRLLRRGNYDVVHCSGGAWQIKGVIAGKLAGRKVVWHLNDTSMPLYVKLAFRVLSTLPDAFVVAGERVKKYYLDEFRIRKPTFEIQAPVDAKVFDPDVVVPLKRPGNAHLLRVVTVGNVNPFKGIEYFIDMAAILQNVFAIEMEYCVVGPLLDSQQAYIEKLQARVATAGLKRLHFYGAARDVRPILRSADIYVCSSVAEASPTSVWEAMAMKKAVVSTDVGDVARFLRNGIAGYIVPPRDGRALAEAVARIAGNPDKIAQFGEEARQSVLQALDLGTCTAKHYHMYSYVAGRISRETAEGGGEVGNTGREGM